MIDLNSRKAEFEKHLEHLSQELKTLRTGRASTALLEHIHVDAYGVSTPLQHCASLSVADARTLVISPWDRSLLKEVEKAIVQANIGVSPINDGVVIRVVMPSLTEENRKNLVKSLGARVEQARVGLRSVRDKIKEEILKAEKAKEMTEDDRFALLKDLDEMTREFTDHVEQMGKAKEQDIMTI
ncbi:ribosome recycling factor [Candidatus Uhrbacteria bacterium]|nr:ribosome recycling factor [Candidatus Uhrbacteria bacterium]